MAGFCKQPSTTPGKVLLSSWWMALLVLTSAYSANLIATLSSQNGIPPFSNLEELLDSEYTIGMRTSSKSSLLGRLWAKIMQNNLEVLQGDLSVHMQRLKHDQYAFLTFRTYAERQMAADCRLGILDERITWEHQSFGVQQKSPIKADIQNV
ncbi:glutamate receptor ionotropic, kainate glr-3-like [Haliotis asinina]|uniref:glutamate receptor ionotropic, kainate glr-3-like n=1 Tax=Haliotis asinina TaxID=109174 RepID=UPI00353242CE